jgi:alpha-L-rhamnosidase
MAARRRSFLRHLGASLAASVALPRAAMAQSTQPRKKAARRKPPAKKPAAKTARTAKPTARLARTPEPPPTRVAEAEWPAPAPGALVDLAPARWLWLPCQRTLANTFVLFRREVVVDGEVASARGWVSADSRYRLFVNGRRVQWGPAPCDPRSYEVDPLDLAAHLRPGANVIGAEVLHYGHGEGTWPGGKPGFIFALRVEERGGRVSAVVTDASWRVRLDRAHRPGQFKRWYLRALQEDYDARLAPDRWSEPGAALDDAWVEPQVLDLPADKPAAAGPQADYLTDGGVSAAGAVLRAREVPLVRETERPFARMIRSGRVAWRGDPRDWFEYRVPGSFEIAAGSPATPWIDGAWRVEPRAGEGAFLTFELTEQMVGFPYLTVEAPAGTVVELVTQESHDPAGPPWLDTHLFTWTRFVCREGVNAFECFDYESLRFLQVHLHDATGPATVRDVGVRRRAYPWPRPPLFRCGEPPVQRVFEASFNTLVNSAEETIVDGMGRERQQYSGDGAHQLHAARLVGGDRQLARRFLRTWPLGQTKDGYFLDCWPAWDRLNRLAQRQLGATPWGPLVDHGVSFVLDAWQHYMEAGEGEPAVDLYPQLVRFFDYVLARRGRDGLLPVEGWGVPAVWIDNGYVRPRHKQLAFNLFTAAVLKTALSPIAALAGDAAGEKRWATRAGGLEAACVRRFWSSERSLFVSNLPWEDEEGVARLDDRSISTALLFDQCPKGRVAESVAALAAPPDAMVLSYPANSHWRMQALARHGRPDAILRELRERWAALPSVRLNNTTPENWNVRPDSPDQWSHCAVGPLFVLIMDLAGIRPAAPGFERVVVRPQLGDLPEVELTCHTPRGPIAFHAEPQEEGHHVRITLPAECPGELRLPARGRGVVLTPEDEALGLERFALPAGQTTEFDTPAA